LYNVPEAKKSVAQELLDYTVTLPLDIGWETKRTASGAKREPLSRAEAD